MCNECPSDHRRSRSQSAGVSAAGTQWRATSEVTTACGRHTVAIAARIDIDGHRREQFWCDDVPVERHVLLRLTCEEAECPQVIAVRAQWLACHGPTPADAKVAASCPRPLMTEVPVVVGRQHFVARPGRFPCFTPCPLGAHPPLRIDKSGFDLFEDGTCLGGGVAKVGACCSHASRPSALPRHSCWHDTWKPWRHSERRPNRRASRDKITREADEPAPGRAGGAVERRLEGARHFATEIPCL